MTADTQKQADPIVPASDASVDKDQWHLAPQSVEPKDKTTSAPLIERMRPMPQTSGRIVNDDAALERCADEMGAQAMKIV